MAETSEKDNASFPQTKGVVDLNFDNTSKVKIKEPYRKEAKLYDKFRSVLQILNKFRTSS